MPIKLIKYVWVAPATLLGLAAVGLTWATGGCVRLVAGAIEAWGGFSAWVFERVLCHGCALTVGHVILGIDERSLNRYRQHEHVHIHQYEKWGLLFIPLYVGSSVMAWMQGKHLYHDNVFEQDAYKRFP